MKHNSVILVSLLVSSWANAAFDVTMQSAELGENQSVTLENSTIFHLSGHSLKEGDLLPNMVLKSSTLEPVPTRGSEKVRIYNILVSVDTPVCVEQAIEFDKLAQEYSDYSDNIEFISVSADTPFAQSRFISEQSISNHSSFLSDSLNHEFGTMTGTNIKELGLLSRAILVVDKEDRIVHIQRVPELTLLPDLKTAFDKAIFQI